jgi:hypothetical protein
MRIQRRCKDFLEQGKEEDVRSIKKAYSEARKLAISSMSNAVSSAALVLCWGII